MEYHGDKIIYVEGQAQDDFICNFVLFSCFQSLPPPYTFSRPTKPNCDTGMPPIGEQPEPEKKRQPYEKAAPMKSIAVMLNLIGLVLSFLIMKRGFARGPDWLTFVGLFLAITTAFSFFMISFGENDRARSLPSLFLKRKRLEEQEKIESIIARRKPPEEILLEDEIKPKE